MTYIRIVSIPPGEAPEAIRKAWVGLLLPIRSARPGSYLGSGVLSGPKSFLGSLIRVLTFRSEVHKGFVVPAPAAIETLEKSDPAAAKWWRENAPHAIAPHRFLIFATECCEVVR